MGPSLFTMPQYIEELFELSNKKQAITFDIKNVKTPVIIFLKMEPFYHYAAIKKKP